MRTGNEPIPCGLLHPVVKMLGNSNANLLPNGSMVRAAGTPAQATHLETRERRRERAPMQSSRKSKATEGDILLRKPHRPRCSSQLLEKPSLVHCACPSIWPKEARALLFRHHRRLRGHRLHLQPPRRRHLQGPLAHQEHWPEVARQQPLPLGEKHAGACAYWQSPNQNRTSRAQPPSAWRSPWRTTQQPRRGGRSGTKTGLSPYDASSLGTTI